MIIGALLILTWLVLLLRYPAKALPISLAAMLPDVVFVTSPPA